MIFDLPPEVQMAIRLRAVKTNRKTAAVISDAVEKAFPKEFSEAVEAIQKSKGIHEPSRR
jgi:hypothetical protein